MRLPSRSRQPRWWTAALICVVAAAGLSCGDDGFTTAGPDEGGVASVRISERDVTLVMGDTLAMSAVGLDKALSAVSGKVATWTSSNTAVATIDARSVLRARAAGLATITAEIDGKADTALVTVIEPPVARLALAPSAATVILTQQKQLVATAFSAKDSVLVGRPLAWTSDNEAVATVNAGGVVATHALGSAVITVASQGKTASATITVVPVPVRQVTVSPSPAQVPLGGTVQLAAVARDSVGGALAGRAVAWTSSAPGVVTVSAGGLLTGVALGAGTVTATIEGVSAQAAVTVAAPSIALSAEAASFAARHTHPSPAAQTVGVSNGGAFTLDGLAAAVAYADGQPTGWLAATLDRTTAPATLTLAAATPALAPGTYTATVTVSSTSIGAAPRAVGVTLVVAPFPVIGLAGTSASFGAQAGAADPAPQTIAVANAGSGALTGLSAGVAYAAGQPTGWLTASLDAAAAPATLTLGASANLPPGSYTATVTVASTVPDVAPKTVNVTHAVTQPAVIALSSASVSFAAQVAGASPAAQTLDVTNGGSGALTGLSVAVAYADGQPAGWLAAALAGTSTATTLSLTPTTGALPAGTHAATVTVSSAMPGVAARTVAVTATVSQTASLALSSGALTFASPSGAAPGTAQTVSVTNAGTGVLGGLTATVTYAGGQPTGWLTASLDRTDAPAVLTAQASAGALPLGTYDATITVASTAPGIAPQAIAVTFTVSDGAVIGLSTNVMSASAQVGGADPAPAAVDVSSQGTVPATGLSVQVAYGAGASGWLDAALGATAAPTTLTLQPRTAGLAIGTHTATVTVRSSLPNVTPKTVDVTFTVSQTASIALSATARAFAGASGAASPAAQTVAVSNGGTGALTGLSAQVGYAGGEPTGWLAATFDGGATAAPATLRLTPTTGALTVGTYTATVTVASALPGVASRTIAVTFAVSQGAQIGLDATSAGLVAQRTDAKSDSAAVAISNAGTGSLTGLQITGIDYGPGATGWLAAGLEGTSAPTKLGLRATVGAPAPPVGSYTATVRLGSTLAGVTPRDVVVTFSVADGAAIGVAPASAAFAAQVQQAAIPAEAAVAVTNAGAGGAGALAGLAVSAPTYGASASGWLAAPTLDGTTSPTTLRLRPGTTALPLGTHTATVTLSSTTPNVAARVFSISYTVSQPASIELSAGSCALVSQTCTFSASRNQASAAAQTVSVGNGGTGTLDQLTLATSYGAGASGWLSASLNTTAAPATLTLTPNVGALAAGTYTAQVQVGSSRPGIAPQTVSVNFTVTAGATIALGATAASFAAQVQQANPASQDVAVTNSGAGTLSGLSASVGGYAVSGGGTPGAAGWLAATFVGAGGTTAPTTLRLQPTTGALAAGTYTATVTVQSSLANVEPKTIAVTFTVSQTASISLGGVTSRSFTAQVQQANPAQQTVDVTNGGSGTLDGLSASVGGYAVSGGGTPGATGWLTATLDATTAPTTLRLQPATGSLAAGTYTATVTVASSRPGVASRSLDVTFTVSQTASITLGAAPTFNAQLSGSAPSNQTVSVSNGGTGVLDGLSVTGVTYDAASGATAWLTTATLAAATAPTTLNLGVTQGALAIGSYQATVTVGSSRPGIAPKQVVVTLNVVQNAVLALAPTTWAPTLQASAAAPATQVVSVSNSGSAGTIGGLSVNTASFPAWLTVSSAIGSTAPTSFTLSASAASLSAGTYTHTVTVSSTTPGVASKTVAVTLTVATGPVIAVSPTSSSATATRTASTVALPSVTITNSGGGTLSGLSASIVACSTGTCWLATPSLSSTTAGTTSGTGSVMSLASTANVAAGSHTATVRVSSTVPGVASVDVPVSLTVQQPSITLDGGAANVTRPLGNVTRGSSPAASTVTVGNGGQGTLSVSLSDDATWITTSIGSSSLGAGATTTLTLNYNTSGLAAGTYTGIVTVSSSVPGVTSRTVTATVTVQQPQITLGANPSATIRAGTATSPANAAVSVSNGGSGTLSGLSIGTITYSGGQSGWITSATLGSTTAPTSVTIDYGNNLNLPYGTYTANIPVQSSIDDVTTKNIVVTLNVRYAYADVQAIIGTSSSCEGCHDQSFTYANLFNNGTTGTACDAVARKRVVAGSASTSLVYQKIAGTHDCGVRMPWGGPYLDATTIQKIADWINGGAHNTIP